MSPPPAVTGRTLLAGVAALALAGCASGGTADGPSRTRSASPAPHSASPRSAADGTELSACADGTCEVSVSGPAKIPVDRKKFKVSTLRVTSIKGDKVSFSIKAPRTLDGRICDDSGCVNFGSSVASSGGATTEVGGGATGPAGSRVIANGVVVTVVSVAGGSAILRVTPRS